MLQLIYCGKYVESFLMVWSFDLMLPRAGQYIEFVRYREIFL